VAPRLLMVVYNVVLVTARFVLTAETVDDSVVTSLLSA
jgi:hypothetical protein